MPPTVNINNVKEESGHVQAMKRGWKNTYEMLVHITTTATPTPTPHFQFPFVSFCGGYMATHHSRDDTLRKKLSS